MVINYEHWLYLFYNLPYYTIGKLARRWYGIRIAMSGFAGSLPIIIEECGQCRYDPRGLGTCGHSYYSQIGMFRLALKGLLVPDWNHEITSACSASSPKPIVCAAGATKFWQFQTFSPKVRFQKNLLNAYQTGRNSTYLFELSYTCAGHTEVSLFLTRYPNETPKSPFLAFQHARLTSLPLSFLQHFWTAALNLGVGNYQCTSLEIIRSGDLARGVLWW